MHPLRTNTLELPEEVGVHAELKHRLRLGLPRELGIEHLIRPGPEFARGVDPPEEVDASGPDLILKRSLVYDIHASSHRGECFFRAGVGRLLAAMGVGVTRDGEPLLPEPLQIGPFVAMPSGSKVLHQRVVTDGALLLASSSSEIEGDEMAAAQEVAEIRGSEDELVRELFHDANLTLAGIVGPSWETRFRA